MVGTTMVGTTTFGSVAQSEVWNLWGEEEGAAADARASGLHL